MALGDSSYRTFVRLQKHTHEPVEHEELHQRFWKHLKAECQKSRDTLRAIYDRVSLMYRDVALDVPYNQVRESMRLWRLERFSPVPDSLSEVVAYTKQPKYEQLFATKDGEPFVQGVVQDTRGRTALICANRRYLQSHFKETQQIFVDGTFKVAPRKPAVYQIVTIFDVTQGHVSFTKNVQLG